jgi:hypothetical protein
MMTDPKPRSSAQAAAGQQPQAKGAPIRHNTMLCVATAADLTYPSQRQADIARRQAAASANYIP